MEDLDMREYIVGYDKESYKYDLYGISSVVVVRQGTLYLYVNANGKWYHFNDTNCNEIGLGSLKTPLAYCFFYRKQKVIQYIYNKFSRCICRWISIYRFYE